MTGKILRLAAAVLAAAFCARAQAQAPENAAAAPKAPAVQEDASAKFELCHGTVSRVDAAASSVTIKQENGQEVTVDYDPKVTTIWQGYEDVELDALKPGTPVDVESALSPETGKRLANWIEIYETKPAAS